jgi:hypothetical protein
LFDDNAITPENPWRPLPKHSLEQSPCYPIIGIHNKYRVHFYYCKLHHNIENIYLESIEHHCKFSNPQLHKSEIIKCLENFLANHSTVENFFLNSIEDRPIKASQENANNKNTNDNEEQITLMTYV